MIAIETIRTQLTLETKLVTLKAANGRAIRRATVATLRFPANGVRSLTFTERLPRRLTIAQFADHLSRERSRDDMPCWSPNFVEAVRGMK